MRDRDDSPRSVQAQDLMADVVVERGGGFTCEMRLRVGAGETVGVIGPNGSGKSTLLLALAGLVPVTRGSVRLGADTLVDTAAGVDVGSDRRGVGVMFQDDLLFPRMSALDNIAFGPRAHRVGRRQAAGDARDWLVRLGIGDCASRRPAELSGGQRRRVALARTLAASPRALLLDEPLVALDAEARVSTRRELGRHLAEFDGPRVLVTHDPVDVAALCDRAVVVEDGRISQSGKLAELGERPASRFVAELVGVNFYSGTASGTAVQLDGGGVLTAAQEVNGPVYLTVHPHAVSLHAEEPRGSARNVWRGRIMEVQPTAHPGSENVRVRIAADPAVVAEVTAAAVESLALTPGREVWVSVKATEIQSTLR